MILDTIKTTGQLFSNYQIQTVKSRITERGEYVTFFASKMNMSMARMGMLLSVYNDDQLYWLKLRCGNAKIFGQCFNWHLFPKKNEEK